MRIEDEIKQRAFQSEYHKVAINIMFTSSWLHSLTLKRLKPFGLSNEQYNVLRILRGQYPNPSSVMLLTDRMLDKSSNASRIVEKLRLKGLVNRSEHPKDRRCVEILITEKGLELLREIDKTHEAWEKNLHAISTEEAAQLNQLLDKMRGNRY